MKVLLILWTIVLATLATTVQTQQEPPDCSVFEFFPWFVNNPINCRAYWYCSHAEADPADDMCPDGYHFDESNQLCNSPIDFPCVDPEDPEPTDEPITDEPITDEPITDEPITDEPITDEPITDEPITDEPITDEPITDEPITDEPITDETTVTTEGTTTVRPPPPRNVCEGLPDGRFVNNPTGCRSFFECRNEIAFERQCDMGLNFNEERQICDRPSFTPCSNDDFECPYFGMSRWEVPGSCTEYNFCFGGQHRVQECAAGLTFDSEMALCALQEEVNCERDLCPVTNDIDNIVTYPSEVDCEQYYKCYDGNRELQFCAPRTHWNQERQRCERPEDAQCELSTTTEEPTTTTEVPIVIECPPADYPFFLPHPSICQNYFLCSNEIPFQLRCIEGLLFDALLLNCNVAAEATCADGATQRITKRKNYFMDHIVRRF